MPNFETQPRQRHHSVAMKAQGIIASKEGTPQGKEAKLQALELLKSKSSIIKDIGGSEDTRKLLGLVLFLIVGFLLKKLMNL